MRTLLLLLELWWLRTLLLLELRRLELRVRLRLLCWLLRPLLLLLHVERLLCLLNWVHQHVRRYLSARRRKLRRETRLVGVELRGKCRGHLGARSLL